MMMTRHTIRRLLALSALLFGIVTASHTANAQAILTASKGADIFVFGGYNYTVPDFGPVGANNTGITLGGDYTRYLGWHAGNFPIDPSLEFRGTDTNGTYVKQRTVLGGLRLHTSLKERYHPYIDYLAGIGSIDYNSPLAILPDHGFAYSIGGGVDIDIVHHFRAMLDYQLQSWSLGTNLQLKPSGADYTLSPTAITIGVSYNIPFSSNVGANSSKPPREPKPSKATPAHTTAPSAPATTSTADSTPATPTPTTPATDTTAPTPVTTDGTTAPTATAPSADTTTPPTTPPPSTTTTVPTDATGTATPPPSF